MGTTRQVAGAGNLDEPLGSCVVPQLKSFTSKDTTTEWRMMTTTYDPSHPSYFDEADFRRELTRVYDICHGCRVCVGLCPSFPSLFDAVDAKDGDAGALSKLEQDLVVDECFGCKMCYVKCPYVPPHEWELDFPRLMLRAKAIKVQHGDQSIRQRLTDQALARTDLVGGLSVALSSFANKAVGTRDSVARQAMQKTVGISQHRLLPPYAKVRFTTWFKNRLRPFIKDRKAKVSVFPTCFIEYMEPGIGKDLVGVYEHNHVECSLPDGAKCCGAPWLHQGNVEQFKAQARKNVDILIKDVKMGKDIVVSQPTCAYVIKKDYPQYLETEDSKEVSAHTYDASEYLIKMHKSGGGIELDFNGDLVGEVTYHAACHLQAQNVGLKGRDLIKLTGAKVNVVSKCSGIDGTWGYRSENYAASKKLSRALASKIKNTKYEMLAGECLLANTAITEETEEKVFHPIEILARAYGFKKE